MALYELTSDPTVIHRISDGAWIPATDLNPDYLAYKAWLAEGNEPGPVPSLPPISDVLTVDDLISILIKKKILTKDDLKRK